MRFITHVFDLETVLSLEQLGLPLDLAQLVTGFFPKYSDRVALAFAKALFMGGQRMSRHERKICNKVFDLPSKAYHYLTANSEWVESCCSELAMWNLNSPPVPEWITMHMPGFVLPVQDHIMLGVFNGFQDARPMDATLHVELPGLTLEPWQGFCGIPSHLPSGSLIDQKLP